MNRRTWLLAAACAIALSPATQSQTTDSQSGAKQARSSAKAQKRTVKQLDGTKLFGFVEVTDDYTIRVTNDWGIIRLPIAELSDRDFRKFGFKKDRSTDGRFWSERKEALEEFKENPKAKREENSGEGSSIEIRLAEISAFEPFIAAYEKTLLSKNAEGLSVPSTPRDKNETAGASFRPILSEQSSGPPVRQTLSRSGTAGMQRVAGAAASLPSPQ